MYTFTFMPIWRIPPYPKFYLFFFLLELPSELNLSFPINTGVNIKKFLLSFDKAQPPLVPAGLELHSKLFNAAGIQICCMLLLYTKQKPPHLCVYIQLDHVFPQCPNKDTFGVLRSFKKLKMTHQDFSWAIIPKNKNINGEISIAISWTQITFLL